MNQEDQGNAKGAGENTTDRGFIDTLLIDDEDISLFITERILSKLSYPMTITKARNGMEALQELRECHRQGKSFSLVLADLNMSVMDGFELIEELKKQPALIGFSKF